MMKVRERTKSKSININVDALNKLELIFMKHKKTYNMAKHM